MITKNVVLSCGLFLLYAACALMVGPYADRFELSYIADIILPDLG